MFNNHSSTLKKIGSFLGLFLVLFACQEDQEISFTDQTIEKNQDAHINISYPKAEGDARIAERINRTVETFLANEINMSEKMDQDLSLEAAINGFDQEFRSFKNDFSDSAQQWEALIEGEVNYESKNIICMTINSYLDTGGAHGNSHVTFLNFDKNSGKLLKREDLIGDEKSFKTLAKSYFEKATKPLSTDEAVEDMFFGESFQLPENIGFNEEGIILLYNVYEIASHAQGITEFTIPYAQAKSFLKYDLE